MSKHTKTPWKLEPADRGYVISALQGQYDVCLVRDIGNEDNEANARHIVKAVNYHDALVRMVKAVAYDYYLATGGENHSPAHNLLSELSKQH